MMMLVRAAKASDIPAMKKLVLESPRAAQWSDDAYQSFFKSSRPVGRQVLVAEESGVVLGFIAASGIDSEWELENAVVAGESRQKGIGKQLVGELLKLAHEHHASAIHLEVRESNQPARGLYESCGFHKSGRRKAYYAGPREDAILYCFSFSSPEK